jgi:hypothetical protein
MKITYNISFYIHESVTNRKNFIENLADSVLGKTLSSLYGMGKPNERPADTITARQIAIRELLDKELNVTLENDSGIPYIDRSGKTRFYSDVGKSELTFNCQLSLGNFVDFSKTLDVVSLGYTFTYNGHEIWRCRCDDDSSRIECCENSLYDEILIDDAKSVVVLDANIDSPSIMMNDLLARISTIELYSTLKSESFGQPISVVDRDYPHDSHDTEPVVHPPVKKAANVIKVTTVDTDAPEATVSEEPVETAEPPKTGDLETIYPTSSAKEVDVAKFYKAATFAIASLDMDSILEVQTFYSKKYNSETNREPWAHMNEKILMKLLAGAVMKHCDELVELMKTNAFSFKNNMFNRKLLQLDGITESVFVGEITMVGDDWLYLIEYSPIRCFGTSDGHS